MKRTLTALLLSGASAFANYDWSRYEGIAERAPFGKEAPLPETADAARPTGEFAKQYRLCTLYKGTTGQLKAGIVSKVNNKNIFLQVGESEKGLSLVEVRLEEGIAVLRQGDETAQLLLEGLGGDPAAALAQRGITAAVAALTPENTLVRQVHRAGTAAVPEHILAELTDSAPKQARITVRDTNPSPSADAVDVGENGSASSPEVRPTVVAKAPVAANYVVQTVPKRYSPF